MATDSTMISAAETPDTPVSATTMHSASVSVAEAVAEAAKSAAATQSDGSDEFKAENPLTESTPGTPSPSPPTPAPSGEDTGFWHDADAERGEIIRLAFHGDATFDNLKVSVSSPFQNFRTQVLPDQTIIVFVPHFFTGASRVSPVFSVSDDRGEIDTFSVSVEYPRPVAESDEQTSPLFRLISEAAIRLPQLPFMRHLFED